MRYVNARYEQEYRDMAYRFYITNSLQNIPQNKYCTTSFSEIIKPKKVDQRSGDEIALDVIKKAGLSFK